MVSTRQSAEPFFIDILIAGVCVMLALLLFPKSARSQLADKPIITAPQGWTGVVFSVTPSPFSACIAGWDRSGDRYGDWLRRVGFVDCGRLSSGQCAAIIAAASAGDLDAMAKLRTVNVDDSDAAVKPCLDKLQAPPLRWAVAPIASGQRPAYLLMPDGTRGAQKGTVPTTINGQMMWCNCKVRSIETTSSTYCSWPLARQTFDPAEQPRVTLCREVKP